MGARRRVTESDGQVWVLCGCWCWWVCGCTCRCVVPLIPMRVPWVHAGV